MNKSKSLKPVSDLGATGHTVAENVSRQRQALNLNYTELAKRLEGNKRPMAPLALRRIEAGARRVDADDLVALAYALEVSPGELLTGGPSSSVTGVPETFEWAETRAWMQGSVRLDPFHLFRYWEGVEKRVLADIDEAKRRSLEVQEGTRRPGAVSWVDKLGALRDELAFVQDRIAFFEGQVNG